MVRERTGSEGGGVEAFSETDDGTAGDPVGLPGSMFMSFGMAPPATDDVTWRALSWELMGLAPRHPGAPA